MCEGTQVGRRITCCEECLARQRNPMSKGTSSSDGFAKRLNLTIEFADKELLAEFCHGDLTGSDLPIRTDGRWARR